MTEEFTKKAAEMLLKGATLLSEPCPYCAGVRVMQEGQALCVSCGRQPEKKEIPTPTTSNDTSNNTSPLEKIFEKKLESLSKELEQEKDHEKQQNILKTINTLLETMEKMKGKQ
ncbi:MAG: Sjogren's syndrome/scleroderma autoantigen 1 family protein [Candidatus Nitrosopumilus sp. Bin_571-38]